MSPTTFFLLCISTLFAMVTSLGCLNQSPGAIPPPTTDCEAAINLIPNGPVFDPSQPGRSDRLDLVIPETHLRSYKLPTLFIAKACSIQIRFHDFPQHPGFSASDLYINFWPSVRALARQIMARCVAQPHDQIWGGYVTGYLDEPGVMAYAYTVIVEGWNWNIYTPHGKLLL